ncbi:scoloptoxin SSD14-like [Dermacentor albipictus]|uniref:scoloptoxin SSD14-like n=1 Tax=Dermacentor albipictus TaxID=60249 RepID=UPI0031FD0540
MDSPKMDGGRRPRKRHSPHTKSPTTPSAPSPPVSHLATADGHRSPSTTPSSMVTRSGTRSPGATSGSRSRGTHLGYNYYSRSRQTPRSEDCHFPMCGQRATILTLSVFSVLVMVAILVTLMLSLYAGTVHYTPKRQPRFVSPSVMGVYRDWVVVSSARQCNNVTRNIFIKNGTVGDAAVATMLCMCVVMPHRCGLGGGFAATYYNRKTTNATAVLATARAPAASSLGMFRSNINASFTGVRAVATFGELKGYELLLNVTGSRVPWRELFEDAITLAAGGVRVYDDLARNIATVADDPDFSARKYLQNPTTTRVLKPGDVYRNEKLAETLRQIADSPVRGRFLHSGPVMEASIKELRSDGGILTAEDFASFKVEATAAVSMVISSHLRLFTTPPPTSGAILAFVMSIVDKIQRGGRLPDDISSAHYTVEALKFGFARRSHLGDPEAPEVRQSVRRLLKELLNGNVSESVARGWIRELPNADASYYGLEPSSGTDHGSGQMCVISPDGDALCLVSSLNAPFGARFLSEVTGVWYNNYMSAFSSPYEQSGHAMPSSENNYIRPGMRPLSSFCPTLIVDEKGNVVFATSATGGQAIISGIVQVLVRCLWMAHNVKQSIDAGRLHNQLHPENVVYHENTTDKDVLASLKWRGHELRAFTWPGAVIAVRRRSGAIYEACHDYRDGTIASSDGGQLTEKPRLPP